MSPETAPVANIENLARELFKGVNPDYGQRFRAMDGARNKYSRHAGKKISRIDDA
jgi:regulator of extracellular matrix RemA (YlzA/DUF370 family)